MRSLKDTIVAPITGAQRAAVCLIRLSGPDAWDIARKVSRSKLCEEPLKLQFTRYAHRDEGFVCLFHEKRSYTGERCAELSIHGSPASVSALLGHCHEAGARKAQPGEFTLRAFLNGRIDLTQAEGVRETIEADSLAWLRAASTLRDGEFRQRVEHLLGRIDFERATIDAHTDFSEEIGEYDYDSAVARVNAVAAELESMASEAIHTKHIREGYRVAIVGLPNAGKSSLFNRLLGSSRAIVTDIAGTTRDTIEERIEHDGVPLVLIDTAGLRDTDDPVDRLGGERTLDAAASADVIWHLFDGAAGLTEEDDRLAEKLPKCPIVVPTKADICARPAPRNAVSSVTGEGVHALLEATVRGLPECQHGSALPVLARHQPLLARAAAGLRAAATDGARHALLEVIGTSLDCAREAVGEIVGQTVNADAVDRLFESFCLGK